MSAMSQSWPSIRKHDVLTKAAKRSVDENIVRRNVVFLVEPNIYNKLQLYFISSSFFFFIFPIPRIIKNGNAKSNVRFADLPLTICATDGCLALLQ